MAFTVLFDGTVFENPSHLSKELVRLKRLQRKLSRKAIGSMKRNKTKCILARKQKTIANQRKDFLQKTSTKIVCSYDVIYMGNLDIKNMVRDSRLVRHREVNSDA